MSDQFYLLRNKFQSLSSLDKKAYLASLSNTEQKAFLKYPDFFLFDKQIIPDTTDWMFFLLRCGRSFGKSYSGSAWVAKKIRKGAMVVGLCGPTYDDVAKVMVPAIISWFLPEELAKVPYNHQTHTLRFANGAVIYCYTSDKSQRGPNLEYLWIDEICAWASGLEDKIMERYNDIKRAVRVGKHPQIIITSTPMNHKFFVDFQKEIDEGNNNYRMITGSMFDNPFLPKSFTDEQMRKYGKTRMGKQELFGHLLTDSPGALFSSELIEKQRLSIFDYKNKVKSGEIELKRIVVGVDPSVASGSGGDECGIVIAGLSHDNKVYILDDYSGQYNPDEWAKRVLEAYEDYNADKIIAESNNGGDLVRINIKRLNKYANVELVHASKSKIARGEPVAGLFIDGMAFLVGDYPELEDQMTKFTGAKGQKSPDRFDSMIWACFELCFSKQSSIVNLDNMGNF